MQGFMGELLHYVQNAARFKWASLALAWVMCLAGWTYVSQMPDVYTASTRVHVDTRSILRPLLGGMTIQPDISSQIRLMTRLIFSRPNLEKIARMTDLDLAVKDEKGMEKLIKSIQDSLKIEGGENNLFTIGYTDPDAKTAKKVTQAVLTLFVEESLGETRQDSDSAQRFLEQQIKEHEQRLLAAEHAREEFKRANYGLMDSGKDLYSQLSQLVTQKEEAKLQVQEAIERRDQIQRQLDSEEPMIPRMEGEAAAVASSPIEMRIQSLRSMLDERLLKFTDNHPEVVRLKKSIADLEKQRQAEISAATSQTGDNTPAPQKNMEANPVYQQMKIALGEAEANIASLTARENAYDGKIELLKQQMDDRLRIETQLQGFNRDYDTVKANYNELLKKRETARMSGTVEQTTDAVKFKIVDPPQVPSKPSAPNRIMASSIVLLGSLLVGMGSAVVLSMFKPSFGTIQGLRDGTGLVVLGGISMNWIPEVRRAKRISFLRFLSAFASLLIVYVGVILLEVKGINLRHLPI
ncbi:MAG: XrtA system polysaccharide chain length determinant [Candidatus Methylumidiphilus sp.]